MVAKQNNATKNIKIFNFANSICNLLINMSNALSKKIFHFFYSIRHPSVNIYLLPVHVNTLKKIPFSGRNLAVSGFREYLFLYGSAGAYPFAGVWRDREECYNHGGLYGQRSKQ